MRALGWMMVLAIGCAKSGAADEPVEPEAAPVAAEVEATPADAPVASENTQLVRPPAMITPGGGLPIADPAAAYARCQTRVEGPSNAGECTTDDDCARVGCSSELCVSKETAASGLMTTCEVLPCFSVLDSCGCVEGMCSWALVEASAPPVVE
jgi:eight-cysteine-cluster-containing protein